MTKMTQKWPGVAVPASLFLMLGIAVPGPFWVIFAKNVKIEMGKFATSRFWHVLL